MDRELSSIFVRVQDENEHWINRDITDCTKEQILSLLNDRDQIELTKWIARIIKLYCEMLCASDIHFSEIPKYLVTECLKNYTSKDLAKIVVGVCAIYKRTGEIFDIRRNPK